MVRGPRKVDRLCSVPVWEQRVRLRAPVPG